MLGNGKQAAQNALGVELYQQVYEFLKYHRRRATDEGAMHAHIKEMVGGNKNLLNHCFNLDGIVFMELMQE